MQETSRTVGRPIKKNSVNALEEVIHSACINFAEFGIKGTSNQMIAQFAGVTPAMVHYYFKTKQELHEAVLENLIAPLLARLENVNSLDSFVHIFHGHLSQHSWAPHLMVREVFIHNGQLRPGFLKHYAPKIFKIIKSIVALELEQAGSKQQLNLERHVILLLSLIVYPFITMEIGESLFEQKFDHEMKQNFRDDALKLFKQGIISTKKKHKETIK